MSIVYRLYKLFLICLLYTSLRDPEDKKKYFDDDEMWNEAESKLREVLNSLDIPYFEAIGEAAFYGPKSVSYTHLRKCQDTFEISLEQYYLDLLGFQKMPEFLTKYLSVPCLLRLKKVGYFCGMDYASGLLYTSRCV